jgi:hypothetical protein
MGAVENLSIDKKRFNMLLKRLKLLDVRESKERVKLKRAIFRMCYEKNKDPEDVDPDLPLFLSTKTEDKWLEKVLGICYIDDDENEIAFAIWAKGQDHNKRPFLVPYFPIRSKELIEKLSTKSDEELEKEELKIDTFRGYEGMLFKVEANVEGKPLHAIECLLLTPYACRIIGKMNETLLRIYKTNVAFGISSFTTMDDKSKLQRLASYKMELAGFGYIFDEAEMLRIHEGISQQEELWPNNVLSDIVALRRAINLSLLKKYKDIIDKSSFPTNELFNRIIRSIRLMRKKVKIIGIHAIFLNEISISYLNNNK